MELNLQMNICAHIMKMNEEIMEISKIEFFFQTEMYANMLVTSCEP